MLSLPSKRRLVVGTCVHKSTQNFGQCMGHYLQSMDNLLKVTGMELLHLHGASVLTKFENLNLLLEGGIRSGTMTEIYGESSTCKTAFCFEFIKSFLAQFSQNNALYISCARSISKEISAGPERDRLFIENAHTLDYLYDFVISNRNNFDKNEISLIIIDPIQFLLKNEPCNATLLMKVNRIMGALRSWVVEMGSFVFIINDAFLKPAHSINKTGNELTSYKYRRDIYSASATRIAPSLGVSWSNHFDLRLELGNSTSHTGTPETTFRVHLCKYLRSNNKCCFELSKQVNDSEVYP